jgi:solute carrier family 25 protein 39/40
MTPLDVLGKRIQAEKLTEINPSTHSHTSIRDTLRQIVQKEGVGRLWAGLSTGLVMAVPNTITYFSVYEFLRHFFVTMIPKYQNRLLSHPNSQDSILNSQFVHNILESTALPPFLAGVFSRLFCTTLVAPLELIRTRQQTYLAPTPPVTGSIPPSGKSTTLSTTTKTPNTQQNITKVTPKAAITTHTHVPSMKSIFWDILYANSSPTTQTTPHSTQNQLSIKPKPRFSNLYRGIGTTLFRDVPFSALYWTFNERSKAILTESNFFCTQTTPQATLLPYSQSQTNCPLKNRTAAQTWLISFISGATAGSLAAVLTHPFEVIKTAQQFQYTTAQLSHHSIDLSKANLATTCRYILQTRGFPGLFTGLVPRVLKIAPSCAVMLSSYDVTKTFLGVKPNISSTVGVNQPRKKFKE